LVEESLRCRDSLNKAGYNVEYIRYVEKIEESRDENMKTEFNEAFLAEIHAKIEKLKAPYRVNNNSLDNTTLIVYENLLD